MLTEASVDQLQSAFGRRKVQAVEIAEIGPDTVLYVGQISAADHLRWSADLQDHAMKGEPLVQPVIDLVAMTLCHEDGSPMVAAGQTLWDVLGEHVPWKVTDRLYHAALEVSGMRHEDQASAEGNSGAMAPDDLPSD